MKNLNKISCLIMVTISIASSLFFYNTSVVANNVCNSLGNTAVELDRSLVEKYSVQLNMLIDGPNNDSYVVVDSETGVRLRSYDDDMLREAAGEVAYKNFKHVLGELRKLAKQNGCLK